jgi:hypothetical protein
MYSGIDLLRELSVVGFAKACLGPVGPTDQLRNVHYCDP